MQHLRTFNANELETVKIDFGIPGTNGPLFVGDRVTLNSGGPLMTVVDFGETHLVAATPNGVEHSYPLECVRRVSPLASSYGCA